jgi:hypothetical protein
LAGYAFPWIISPGNDNPTVASACDHHKLQQARVRFAAFSIDRVYINQANYDERAVQVMTMQRIYHSAEKVFVWLGEEGNNSQLAVGLIQQFQKIGEETLAGKTKLPSRDDLHKPNVLTTLGLPPFPSSPAWRAFMSLFARPVFHHIWIVQELVPA